MPLGFTSSSPHFVILVYSDVYLSVTCQRLPQHLLQPLLNCASFPLNVTRDALQWSPLIPPQFVLRVDLSHLRVQLYDLSSPFTDCITWSVIWFILGLQLWPHKSFSQGKNYINYCQKSDSWGYYATLLTVPLFVWQRRRMVFAVPVVQPLATSCDRRDLRTKRLHLPGLEYTLVLRQRHLLELLLVIDHSHGHSGERKSQLDVIAQVLVIPLTCLLIQLHCLHHHNFALVPQPLLLATCCRTRTCDGPD